MSLNGDDPLKAHDLLSTFPICGYGSTINRDLSNIYIYISMDVHHMADHHHTNFCGEVVGHNANT